MTAATLLREARQRAELTQAELAARAGVPQSTISAYESGRREPGFDAFARIVRAAGLDLRLGEQSALERVRAERAELVAALEPFGVTRIRVFGSVARGTDRPDSDVDLLVDLSRPVGVIALGQLTEAARGVLGRAVDVVPVDSLRTAIRDEVLGDAVPL